ncbi:hypothetical protein QZH41_017251, partial [Actinostola sp. cb2023]
VTQFKNNNVTSPVKYHRWSYDEERALVEFISISKSDPCYGWPEDHKTQDWPSFRADHVLWADAANHKRESNSSNFLLTTNKRSGIEEPLFPLDRMPFGLVAYQIEFFACTNIMQISIPPDFAMWHESLCAEFPTRFNRIFRGPMWSSLPIEQHKDPLT